MKLERDTIKTDEVLGWKGLHLLNFAQSSCSQKVRILLAEKREGQALSDDLSPLEDQLHDQLRAITMGFLAPRRLMAKSEAGPAAYKANGPVDGHRNQQIEWSRETDIGALCKAPMIASA